MNEPTPAVARAPRPPASPRDTLRWVWRQHWLGSAAIVLAATWLIAGQVSSRADFASTELGESVQSRWGAPVEQAAPSVRAVQSGTVFTELAPLPLAGQQVVVEATMNYRKRGLAYFSGFDFVFDGTYRATNPEAHPIDVAFIFPIEVNKSQVLLSELAFTVDGAPASLDLGARGNRLVWTGQLGVQRTATFHIRYRARGLESFVYRLDPSLPAREVDVRVAVVGGDNVDYPDGVLAASEVTRGDGGASLRWRFPSLESGVALGVILPSLKKYDELVATMAFRALVPGLAFLVGLSALALWYRRRLASWETYLAAAAFGFTYVLLAYLGAFLHVVVAWVLALAVMGAAVVLYVGRLFPAAPRRLLAGGWVALQVLPTLAVLLPGYTGLLYTLELLAGLLAAMVVVTHAQVRALLSDRLAAGGAS